MYYIFLSFLYNRTWPVRKLKHSSAPPVQSLAAGQTVHVTLMNCAVIGSALNTVLKLLTQHQKMVNSSLQL